MRVGPLRPASSAVLIILAAACDNGRTSSSQPDSPPPPTTTGAPIAAPPVATSAPARVADDLCSRTGTEVLGTVQSADLVEASGLAVSRSQSGIVWAHNDSGGEAGVFAIGGDGADLGFSRLVGIDVDDVEDMAILSGPDGDDLLLADFGDNELERGSILIHRFPEPAPGADVRPEDITTTEYVYPDRAHNAEALLVDEELGAIVIVTKEQQPAANPPTGREPTAPSFIFQGPLSTIDGEAVILAEAGVLDAPALEQRATADHPADLLGFGGVPTGGDVSADGALVAIRTYATLWLWQRAPGDSVAEALLGDPCEVTTRFELQGEAVAFDGSGLISLGEGEAQPIHALAR